MRKRSLASRQKRPLILTALDRKRAGMPPEGLKKKERVVRKKNVRKNLARTASIQELPFFEKIRSAPVARAKTIKPKRTTRIKKSIIPKTEFFSPPIIDSPEVQTQKPVGKITHYYDKIKVGVIEITGEISVGDCISYETADGGNYEQIIESMEINRQPVFNAKKGDDIGIKLRKAPRIDSKVYAA